MLRLVCGFCKWVHTLTERTPCRLPHVDSKESRLFYRIRVGEAITTQGESFTSVLPRLTTTGKTQDNLQSI